VLAHAAPDRRAVRYLLPAPLAARLRVPRLQLTEWHPFDPGTLWFCSTARLSCLDSCLGVIASHSYLDSGLGPEHQRGEQR
jgi:hypothetical protein